MKRAVDIGPVDAAAIKTSGGKVRLRLLFTTEQLEALLVAARNGDLDDDADMKRSVTQCNAREEKNRTEVDDDGDAREAPTDPSTRVFVIQGTPAWAAWTQHKRRTTGRDWDLTTSKIVEGKTRTGWYFPTLFPPQPKGSTGPPSSTMTEDDKEALADLK